VLRALLVLLLASSTFALDRETARRIESFGEKWWKARPKNRFHGWDPAKRKALLEEAAKIEIPEGSWQDVRELLWKSLRRHGPKGKGRDKVVLDSPYEQEMWAFVSNRRGRDKGLVVGLHGGGKGAGTADEPRGTWRMKDCVGIYPQGLVLDGDNWNTVQGERQILSLIEIAKAQYDVDPDRVYVMGFSMGGTGSWHMAGRWPDLFSGAAPCAGVIMARPKSQLADPGEVMALQYGLLPNVRNLAMYWFIGLEDKNCMPGTYLYAWERLKELREDDPGGYGKLKFESHENLAHAMPPGEPDKCMDWLSEQKRDTFPEKLVWSYATHPFPVRKEFDRTTRIQKHWFHWLHDSNPLDRMEIVAERKGNEFDVTTTGEVAGLRVLMNPEMIDVEKEVVVRLDGDEVYRGKPEPSFRVIVESLDAKLDKRMFFDRAVPLR